MPERDALRSALRAVLSDFNTEPSDAYLDEALRIFLSALAVTPSDTNWLMPGPEGQCEVPRPGSSTWCTSHGSVWEYGQTRCVIARESLEGYWERAYWRIVPRLAEVLLKTSLP